MDKYTVDLDKVLNDFEYSELTDQCSNVALQRLKSNTPVKHTINNVFQSLNEYLNSDISCNRKDESDVEPVKVDAEAVLVSLDVTVATEPKGSEEESVSDVISTDDLELTEVADVVPATVEESAECDSNEVPVGFDDSIGVNDEELHMYLDALESELNPQTERPSTLSLIQTPIDLIGEPGSTPYNNMYTTPADKPPDPDTSLSASPTFSDVSSTGSNISTATTESVTDSIVETVIPVPISVACDDEVVEITQVTEVEEVPPPPSQTEPETNLDCAWLGKEAPLWIPDSEALNCLHCDIKFTVIKRRHHCRACGLVLCSKCCNLKFKLEYLDAEARVCLKCHDKLTALSAPTSETTSPPNPNNPMEYCSTIPPLQQSINAVQQNPPPSVMVPVGVLKRTGSAKPKTNKTVMFCDGIRPGSELTNLDNDFNYSMPKKKGPSPPPVYKPNRNMPGLDALTKSFIPSEENLLPPIVTIFKSDINYSECLNGEQLVETLKNDQRMFVIQNNLYVNVRIINMDCCINKRAWCFSTQGMITAGQDEIVLLLELCDDEKVVPKDIFTHLNHIYVEAKKGSSISENGISLHPTPNFLASKNHMGFLYIRTTFQCLQNVIVPKEPYLIGILIHKWEMPWAKIFPLRLVLRLGAAYRYYPSPIISIRNRESVYVEIGHTIINLLADFRNYTYTLPNIRGLTIHIEGKNTTVNIPKNRYDQVLKSLNTSSDQTLAFSGNFSTKADSHLVCVQDVDGNNENTYTTHSISIQNRPRIVTGVNFIVFNGSLKSSSGLNAKFSFVEDGVMIQILPEQMLQIHESLRGMKDYTIMCGSVNAPSDEIVDIIWGENDSSFNQGVISSVDNQSLSGVPSIRVHNGKDFFSNSGSRMIRWTEVFIMQSSDENACGQEIDFSKLSENIAKASCQALVKYLDLLSSNNFYKIGIRALLHSDNVSYSAGSNGTKLPPIYMKSLDNELIQVLHRITANNNLGEKPVILELIFHILNV